MEITLTTNNTNNTLIDTAKEGAIGYGIGYSAAWLAGHFFSLSSSTFGVAGCISAIANFIFGKFVDALGSHNQSLADNSGRIKTVSKLVIGAATVVGTFALGLIGPVGAGIMGAVHAIPFIIDLAGSFNHSAKEAPAAAA